KKTAMRLGIQGRTVVERLWGRKRKSLCGLAFGAIVVRWRELGQRRQALNWPTVGLDPPRRSVKLECPNLDRRPGALWVRWRRETKESLGACFPKSSRCLPRSRGARTMARPEVARRSEEHMSELQSRENLV